jgi:outer membrane protein
MKYTRVVILLLAVVWLTHSSLPAQNPWSLAQCISYAWDNNISIKQQTLSAEQSENALFQSKMNFIPSAGARVSHSMSWGRSVDMNNLEIIESKLSQTLSPNISASIDLFEGLQKVNTVKKSRADYRAALQDVNLMKDQIALEIARAYLQVLLTREILATAEKSHESVTRQQELTRQLVDAGSQPHSTLLEIDAQLASEEVQLVNARNQVDIAYLTLRQLLDIAPDTDFEIITPEISIPQADPNRESTTQLYTQAQHLPQIQTAELRRESAQHALAIARGRYWPTLSFSAGYGTFFTDTRSDAFWQQIGDNRSPSLQFGLSIPIFQNWNIVTGSKNAKLNLRIAELEVDKKHQVLYKEIQQAIVDASAAYNKYKAGLQNVTAMQESFRYTQQKFDIGLVNGTDYTVSKNNLFKAESDLLQAKYQYVFQLKIIDFYKGIPITL